MLEYILLSKTFRNRERRRDFDFALHRGNGSVGVSALMRVKNELVEAVRQEHDEGHNST